MELQTLFGRDSYGLKVVPFNVCLREGVVGVVRSVVVNRREKEKIWVWELSTSKSFFIPHSDVDDVVCFRLSNLIKSEVLVRVRD